VATCLNQLGSPRILDPIGHNMPCVACYLSRSLACSVEREALLTVVDCAIGGCDVFQSLRFSLIRFVGAVEAASIAGPLKGGADRGAQCQDLAASSSSRWILKE